MLLADNGQLIFLDFGLISRMEPNIMEGFAEGIQYMISGDWYSLSRVFQVMQCVGRRVRSQPSCAPASWIIVG